MKKILNPNIQITGNYQIIADDFTIKMEGLAGAFVALVVGVLIAVISFTVERRDHRPKFKLIQIRRRTDSIL